MVLTKSNLFETISERLDLSPIESKSVLETLLKTMKATLASGEDIMISGFGKFQINDKSPRKGRNIAIGVPSITGDHNIKFCGINLNFIQKRIALVNVFPISVTLITCFLSLFS